MDWPDIIKRLRAAGWTQEKLAERCECAQSTISDLASGKTAAPSYGIGRELERIVASLAAPKPKKVEAA